MNAKTFLFGAAAIAIVANPVLAQNAPQDLLPPDPAAHAKPSPVPSASPMTATGQDTEAQADHPTVEQSFTEFEQHEVVQPTYAMVANWTVLQAKALVKYAEGIGTEGLDPKDYQLDALAAAIAQGPGDALNQAASQTFDWLVEDLRDGRTPMEDRLQWFVVDPDPDRMPTGKLLAQAVKTGKIAATLHGLDPVNPDYAKLKAELAKTTDPQKRLLIRANMDRWRWLPQDLGTHYLLTNIPEYKLRLVVHNRIIKSYRAIVGKPGRTATPQLAESVEAVVFNPTWTVPQSIVQGEGLGAKVLNNPAWAKSAGYKATKGADGVTYVVQQPGANNSLGLMKLDMPNPHAIFIHDTPQRYLFNKTDRDLSHGCVRVQDARELGMTMAMLGNMTSKEDIPTIQAEVQDISTSGKYTRYPLTNPWPVYLTYFTMASDVDGKLRTFDDIYDRDAPVIASFSKPREANRARKTSEKVVPIIDDLQT
ncbi:L,D-transpeptidase family protein [Porphyrobacter algicida]|uniref:L,D-transpeptidase family protein n=1 Tax=Qipengyuania algicida TaxID=1836209 RepID=A0A845AJE7_9SPHN|nr:L,D-transpeptidase family protein [Qipengyuania algicida]MXP29537.1 L,D-transpeptidase family protein [Qipengyuania algicida]